MNEILDELKISHLKIYDSVSSSQVWEDWGKENGIVSKFINAQLVVTDVLPHSEAMKKGVRRGDIAISFKGEDVFPNNLTYGKGDFEFRRNMDILKVHLEPAVLEYEAKIKTQMLSKDQMLIKIPSYKSQYFKGYDFKNLVNQANKAKQVILDLRGNAGGNFVAGLQSLSLFICSQQVAAEIIRPRFHMLPENNYPDDLDDDKQIDIVNASSKLRLQTFANYPCLNPKIKLKVIIDADTASTAEFVANALRELRHAKIYGAASSGQLLVGIWYNLKDIWQQDYKITIPEAIFKSAKGLSIEGVGVSVDQVIYDHLDDYKDGQDSWLKQVMQSP
jgi:carboxyl-terminal processing protease